LVPLAYNLLFPSGGDFQLYKFSEEAIELQQLYNYFGKFICRDWLRNQGWDKRRWTFLCYMQASKSGTCIIFQVSANFGEDGALQVKAKNKLRIPKLLVPIPSARVVNDSNCTIEVSNHTDYKLFSYEVGAAVLYVIMYDIRENSPTACNVLRYGYCKKNFLNFKK